MDGEVKTLEEWEVGRETNRFSKTRVARIVAAQYRRVAKTWDVFYLWLDKISGGDEAERRMEERELEGEMEDFGADEEHRSRVQE